MSVEAALLLPVALTLIALLVQPVCVLYTRSVMSATAGELARLMATTRGTEEDVRSYALRRLAAVPDLSIFHVGGSEGWEVTCEGPDEEGVVRVSIAGHVRPLPLMGAIVYALGPQRDGNVRLAVEVSQRARASWIGGNYEDWIKVWG